MFMGRAQLFSLGDNKVIGSNAVNEFHFGYLRKANVIGKRGIPRVPGVSSAPGVPYFPGLPSEGRRGLGLCTSMAPLGGMARAVSALKRSVTSFSLCAS
jgi:hypothetical protein